MSVAATGGKYAFPKPVEVPRPEYLRRSPEPEPAVGRVDPAWTKDFLERRRLAAWGNTSEDDVGGVS